MKEYNFSFDLKDTEIKKKLRGETSLEVKDTFFVNDDAKFIVNGKVVGYLIKGFDKDSTTAPSLEKGDLIYSGGRRGSGIPNDKSSTFGWLPRVVIRSDFCRLTKSTLERPVVKNVLYPLAEKVSKKYQEIDSETFIKQKEIMSELSEDFFIPNTIFTSGIVNKNSRMRYHTDAGNFPGIWSCTLIYKRNVEGGNLHLPELGLVIGFDDGDLILFDNQKYLHGVTKIIPKSKYYYRYSIVFYSLKGMLNCLPYKEEMERYNKRYSEVALDYNKKKIKSIV